MPFSLQIDDGALAGRRYVFDQDEVSLGRTEENDVVVPSDAASRHHARLTLNGEGYQIEDLRSSNGTRVNGEPLLRPLTLEDGDVIEIGNVRFRFSPYHAVGGTKIVAVDAVPQWEKGRAKPPERRPAPPPSAPSRAARAMQGFEKLPRRQQTLLKVGAALICFFVLAKVVQSRLRSDGGPDFVDRPVPLTTENNAQSYGYGRDVDRLSPRGVVFTFNYSEPEHGRSLLKLHGTVVGIRHGDDVDMLVNGQHSMFLPATFDEEVSLDVALDRGKLLPNAENKLMFKPANGEVEWGIADLRYEQISLPTGTYAQLVARAKQQYELGEAKFENQNVAATNLYEAWKYYQTAQLTLAALPKPPEQLRNLVDTRLKDAANQLDKRCGTMKLAAMKAFHGPESRRFEDTSNATKDILNYFPQSDHRCNGWAVKQLARLAQVAP